jgi:hypothetical protein
MKADVWDLSWCKQGDGYKFWLPSMRKADPPEAKEKPPVTNSEPKNTLTSACFNCGTISFMPVKKCDICRKPFNPPQIPPRSKQKSSKKQHRKMNFQEFEATKIKRNRLKTKWELNIVMEPPPRAKIKILESQINNLTAELKANLYHAFLFQPERNYE